MSQIFPRLPPFSSGGHPANSKDLSARPHFGFLSVWGPANSDAGADGEVYVVSGS
jgi:hypothetical protein